MKIKHLFQALGFMLLSTNVAADSLLINQVTLVSAERKAPLKNANVLITDGVISEISVKPVKAGNAQVIDGKGKYLTPGLMDSHVHLGSMPGLIQRPDMPEYLKQLKATFDKNQPRAYLYYGVTELLDLSQTAAGLQGFLSNPVRPDLSFCGSIRVLDGYGTAGLSAEQVMSWGGHLLFDHHHGFEAPEGINPENHTPEKLVKDIKDDGAICVKLFFEDGFGEASHWKILNNTLVQEIRTEAKKHGLIVVGHANAIDMHTLALENKVDVIAHGLWNWNQLEGQPGLPEEIEALINQVVADDRVFQPTFNVMEGLAGVLTDKVFNDPAYNKVVPKVMRQWYQSDEGKWFRQELLSEVQGLPPEQLEKVLLDKLEQSARVVKRLSDMNHPLVLASDTPSSPTYAAQPGYSTHRELRQMFNAGMTLKQIFSAATLNNAKAFGMEKDYGTIAPGKKANLLLLSQNPLEQIEAYNSIEKVILRGEVIERESLRAN